MALTFNPVQTNLPTPSSFAGAPMGATVNPNSLSSLGELTNIQATRQGIATSQQALAKAQATYGADVAKAQTEAEQAATNLKSAQVKLGNEQIGTMYSVLSPYGSDDRILQAANIPKNATPEQIKSHQDKLFDVADEIDKGLEARGWGKTDRRQYSQELNTAILTNPASVPSLIKRATQTLAGAQNIASQNQPNFGVNAAGQTTSIIPAQGGNSFQVVQPDNVANAPAPIGAIPAGVAPTNAAPVPRPNPNPSTAQVGMANAASKTMAEDFNATQMAANEAQPRIATFQNIKKLVPDAYTGVGGERKKFLTGVANAVGLDVNTLENSTTDELAKNSAILQLAGGNTDAARAIASIANPSGKMTKNAIINITDQMIGMEKLKEAKANFLAPVSNDPAAYQRKLSQFNLVNDYRIFQESNPEQIKKLKASMSQEEQNAISAKIKLARQMGLIR
jgi:hypothetical protein